MERKGLCMKVRKRVELFLYPLVTRREKAHLWSHSCFQVESFLDCWVAPGGKGNLGFSPLWDSTEGFSKSQKVPDHWPCLGNWQSTECPRQARSEYRGKALPLINRAWGVPGELVIDNCVWKILENDQCWQINVCYELTNETTNQWAPRNVCFGLSHWLAHWGPVWTNGRGLKV